MTRLEQALRWWENADGIPIPSRHCCVLRQHEIINHRWDDDGNAVLTRKGKAALRARENPVEGK